MTTIGLAWQRRGFRAPGEARPWLGMRRHAHARTGQPGHGTPAPAAGAGAASWRMDPAGASSHDGAGVTRPRARAPAMAARARTGRERCRSGLGRARRAPALPRQGQAGPSAAYRRGRGRPQPRLGRPWCTTGLSLVPGAVARRAPTWARLATGAAARLVGGGWIAPPMARLRALLGHLARARALLALRRKGGLSGFSARTQTVAARQRARPA